MTCTWEVFYDLPKVGGQELVRQAQTLKSELTVLRFDYFEDTHQLAMMVGDVDALTSVIVRMATRSHHPSRVSATLEIPLAVTKLAVILDNAEDDDIESARWEELEP